MPSRSKEKGDREERQLVDLLRKNGFNCERTLERGKRSDGSDTWDIDLYVSQDLKIECKMRGGNAFTRLYNWINGRDILTLRSDRKQRLYVVTENLMLKILKGYNER